MITEAIFRAFLQCPLKARHLLSGRTPAKDEDAEFDERIERIHIDKVRLGLGSIFSPEASSAMPLVHEDLSTHPDALERIAKRTMIVPIRIFRRARISDLDKLRLGFDGLVIGHVYGKVPTHGVAIIGPDFRKSRVALPRLVRRARRSVDALRVMASGLAPRLVINRHCETCGFRDECRRRAVDTDDLSLMSGLKKAELAAAHKKASSRSPSSPTRSAPTDAGNAFATSGRSRRSRFAKNEPTSSSHSSCRHGTPPSMSFS